MYCICFVSAHEDQPIQCFVFGVKVNKEFSVDYKVNGFNKSLMQRSNQTLVEKKPLNKKKTVCKKTVSTPIVNRFAITGVSNIIGDISNSSVTIQECGRDYVQRRRELTPDASSSMTNTHSVNLSSNEDCVRDDHSVDEEVGDEEIGDDDSVDSEWEKDGIKVGDDDNTDSEKDLEGDDNMGGVVNSDGKLSNYNSDDSPDEIDW
ncbi:hypothetical protein NE237_013700 [Protea cynaroides]|uniref:Uncharacterized protein n=1 Tax=Protea cynaroides TaxID=273540 RepID=A0A9Q0GZ40_9MAGN|nr:hypothetical protein NE237_013700 [Protea cynaroides]